MKKKIIYFFNAILILLTLAGLLKAVFVGLDIDESYSLALAYRLFNGDKLVIDMWEPHQFSAVFTAVFLIPFLSITGSCEYAVIFLRIVSIVIHCLIGVWLYKTLTNEYEMNIFASFLMTIIHINFLPKWIQSTEFELVTYWCLLSGFLLLSYYYLHKQNSGVLFAAGVVTGLTVLCYPTCVVLCVYLFVAVLILSQNKKKSLFVAAGIASVAFLQSAWLLSMMSLKEFLRYIPYIFMDASHTSNSIGKKTAYYVGELPEIALTVFLACLVGFICAFITAQIQKKKFDCTFIAMGFVYSEAAMCMATLAGMAFFDGNQFFLQERYILLPIAAMILVFAKGKMSKEDKVLFFFGMIPTVVSFASILFVTNMDLNVSFAKLFCATLVSLVIVFRKTSKNTANEIAAISLLLVLMFCRLIMLRVTGCAPVTIKADTAKMTKGAEKGIYCPSAYVEVWNYVYDNLKPALEELGYDNNSNLLIVTAENLSYLNFDMKIGGPSVQGTTVYNEMYLNYYNEHPERIPDVVVFDASFEANPYYNYSEQNEILKDWVRKNYSLNEEAGTMYYEVYVR